MTRTTVVHRGVRWEVERLRGGLVIATTLSPWPFRRISVHGWDKALREMAAVADELTAPRAPKQKELNFTN